MSALGSFVIKAFFFKKRKKERRLWSMLKHTVAEQKGATQDLNCFREQN